MLGARRLRKDADRVGQVVSFRRYCTPSCFW
jgi:hypothetical protein